MAARVGRGRIGGMAGGVARGRGRGRGRGGSVGAFIRPQTGRQAARVANAEAGAEDNAAIRQSREEAKGSRKRQQDLGHWYAQLASDYQQAENAGAAALKSAEGTTTQELNEASAASSAEQQRLANEDEKFAALVGGPRDTAGLAKIAEAGAAAASARAEQAKTGLSEEANFIGRVGQGKAAARLQGISARQEEAQRREKIQANLAAQRKEKGQARVANLEKIREADRSYVAEQRKLKLAQEEAATARQAAAASAALAQLKATHEAKEDAIANRQAQERIGVERSNAKISAKNARTSARSQRATERHYRHEGGLTAAEKSEAAEGTKGALAAAKSILRLNGVPKTGKEWAGMQVLLQKEDGISPAQAASAIEQLQAMQKAKRRGGYARRVGKGTVDGPPTPRGR